MCGNPHVFLHCVVISMDRQFEKTARNTVIHASSVCLPRSLLRRQGAIPDDMMLVVNVHGLLPPGEVDGRSTW